MSDPRLEEITNRWHEEENAVVMTKPLSRQEAKEKACRMGIREGYALMRRGDTEVWRVYPDGRQAFLCRTQDPNTLWHSAVEVISYENKRLYIASPPVRFMANVVHNVFIHPLLPFTWGKVGEIVELLHDVTGQLAYGGDKGE